jgi:hypothetical protein
MQDKIAESVCLLEVKPTVKLPVLGLAVRSAGLSLAGLKEFYCVFNWCTLILNDVCHYLK